MPPSPNWKSQNRHSRKTYKSMSRNMLREFLKVFRSTNKNYKDWRIPWSSVLHCSLKLQIAFVVERCSWLGLYCWLYCRWRSHATRWRTRRFVQAVQGIVDVTGIMKRFVSGFVKHLVDSAHSAWNLITHQHDWEVYGWQRFHADWVCLRRSRLNRSAVYTLHTLT